MKRAPDIEARVRQTVTPGALALWAMTILLAGEPASAQDAPLSWGPAVSVRPADSSVIRHVIDGQLEAFARGDRSTAYDAAAPNIRRKFPSAGTFDAMARADDAPLFDVAQATFTPPRGAAATATHAETWSQGVEISTRNGERWSAIYGLERQPDGSIAITSCVLIRRPDPSS